MQLGPKVSNDGDVLGPHV